MKALAALLFLAACMPAGEARASSARFGERELVEQSDLIVSATLVRIERHAAPGSATPRETGILTIRQVLKGPGKPGAVRLDLVPAGTLRSSSDIVHVLGQKGLWFLRSVPPDSEGPLYRADHPQRFLPDEEASARMRYFQDLVKARKR